MLFQRFILLWYCLLLLQSLQAATSPSTTSTNEQGKTSDDSEPTTKPFNESKPLRIAFCVNGQLARLELYSKIKNIFIPNARIGNLVHVFIYLDNEVNNVKQTYWNYDYSNSLYGSHSRKEIKAIVDDAATVTGFRNRIRTRVLLQPPPRHIFPVNNNGTVPVNDKPFTGHDGPHDLFETAASRFQNNMRWMAGLRECARWVMAAELDQKWFYDVVVCTSLNLDQILDYNSVRLRDDTFAFGPWLLSPPSLYRGGLSSMSMGNFGGINDHNFVVDRLWLDDLYRGLTEDYYFNSSLEHEPWGNPEHHILQVVYAYNIPLKSMTVCEQPLIPLRGLVNESYWYVHPFYVRQLKEACWPQVIRDDKNDADDDEGDDDEGEDDDDDDDDDDADDDKKKKDKKEGNDKKDDKDKKETSDGKNKDADKKSSSSSSSSKNSVDHRHHRHLRSSTKTPRTTTNKRKLMDNHSNSKNNKEKENDNKDAKGGGKLTSQPTFQPRTIPSCCVPIWQDIVHYKAVKVTSFSSYTAHDKDDDGKGSIV